MNGYEWCYPGRVLLLCVVWYLARLLYKRRFVAAGIFAAGELLLAGRALLYHRESNNAEYIRNWHASGRSFAYTPDYSSGINEAASWLGFWAWCYIPGFWLTRLIVQEQIDKQRQRESAQRGAEFQAKRDSLEYKRLIQRTGLLNGGATSIPIGYADIAIRRSWEQEPTDYQQLHYSGDRHVVTFGPTGSGKNTTSQTPALLTYPGSCFVIDPKGQLAAITTRQRQRMGQETANINPFGVLGLPTATYNPLHFLDPASLSFTSDCDLVADGLVMVNSGSKSDHFDTSARSLVSLVMQWLISYGEGIDRKPCPKDLIAVRSIVNEIGDEKRRTLFFETMQGCDKPLLAESAGRWLSKQGEVTDCISTAQNNLRFLADPALERSLRDTGGRSISFADMKRRGLTVYLLIPSKKLRTHGRFLRLMVMSAMAELMDDRLVNPTHPVLFMLDEFAQLGQMSLIEDVASISRDYKLKLWIILQNLPQLRKIYGDDGANSFMSAAGVVQFFTPNDPATAAFISNRSGVKIETFTTKSTSTGTSTAASGGGTSSGESYTDHERERPVIRAQEAYALAGDTAQYLILPGIAEVINAERKPYWETFVPGLAGHDPYHMTHEQRAAWDGWLADGATYFHHGSMRRELQAAFREARDMASFAAALEARGYLMAAVTDHDIHTFESRKQPVPASAESGNVCIVNDTGQVSRLNSALMCDERLSWNEFLSKIHDDIEFPSLLEVLEYIRQRRTSPV